MSCRRVGWVGEGQSILKMRIRARTDVSAGADSHFENRDRSRVSRVRSAPQRTAGKLELLRRNEAVFQSLESREWVTTIGSGSLSPSNLKRDT